MIEGTSCGQIFSQKSAWQENAFNELKDSLTATRENGFIRYKDEKETYLVMICGKSQIGKSTLILKLIGIRDECFREVYDTLRAGVQQGNSSTVTAIIYAKSATDQYALAFARLDGPAPEKKYYAAQDVKAALQQIRKNVEDGQHTSAEEILFIDIPGRFFVDDAAVDSLQIMDMPGVESRNEKEWPHVRNLMDSYFPLSQVCIVACSASDIQSMGAMKLPAAGGSWQNRPERFMVVSMASYSPENVRAYFQTERAQRKEMFSAFIQHVYGQTFQNVMGENTKLELYPVDLGQSLEKMLNDLDQKDAAEVRETLEENLHALRNSIRSREGRRFQSAIEDLRSRVDSYAGDELDSIEKKFREDENAQWRLEERIEKAKKTRRVFEQDDELEQRHGHLERAKKRLQDLIGSFPTIADWKIHKEMDDLIENEHLYREKSSGRYLKDQKCSERDDLADRKVLAAVLNVLYVQLEECWMSVCAIYTDEGLEPPKKSGFPELEIIENARTKYYPQYYPKGIFSKVLCKDLEQFNKQMVEEAGGMLQYKCFTGWDRDIGGEIRKVENQQANRERVIREKCSIQEQAEQELENVNNELAVLQRGKSDIMRIRERDRDRLKKYLEVARRHYSVQRDEVLTHIRNSTSAEEKTKWVLMLALTDHDYESLRRTGNGNET